ncbi:heterokaryon incompatibility protein-domain-containing protein [Xylariaceae sp. AK1471]|nr:heterokaryon incompatibility protein-domain-containing protein [Xylariaceae sp. AK1471]
MPVFNGYQYEPLGTVDTLRLIALSPAQNKRSPPRCSIIQGPISTLSTIYCAISYTWGPRNFTHHLEIEHDGDTSFLRITTNVDLLLRYLRGQNKVRHFWIDAVCLNQDDDAEKVQQVPLMGYIYRQAQQVHIWLGTDDDTIPRLFRFFRAASQIQENEQHIMARHLVSLMRKHFNRSPRDGIGRPGVGNALKSIWDFFNRPWFSRRWVIQEAYLARQAIAHCGDFSIPMCVVATAAHKYQSMDMSSYQISVAASLHRLKPSSFPSLLELLWSFHEAECADKRDRIAALAGLIPDNSIHLDYVAPWDVMYKQVASQALRSGDNGIRLQILLHLFEFGSLSQSRNISCPTWVPDWSSCRNRKLPYHSQARNVDNIADYPTPLGCTVLATLILNNEVLEVHPSPSSIAIPRTWQVVYATKIGTYSDNEEPNSDRVVQILQRMFPCITSDSVFEVLEFSSLVQMMLEFRHSEARDQVSENMSLKLYITRIAEMLPEPIHVGFLGALQKLSSLIKDTCLFALEPLQPMAGVCRAYGLCLTQVLSGDVMVPLWHREDKATGEKRIGGGWRKTIDITTMLALSHGKKQQQSCESSSSKGTRRLIYDAIAIPALCIIPRNASSTPKACEDNMKEADCERQALICFA